MDYRNISDKPTITNAFEKEWIDYAIHNLYELRTVVNHLFITIDPSAGKDLNYYVLSSFIFVDGKCVVCIHYKVSSISLRFSLVFTVNPYNDIVLPYNTCMLLFNSGHTP